MSTVSCGHPLCEIIGGACSLATHRSRGCRPNVTAKEVAAEVIDEVRQLLAALDRPDAPARLATLVRREALEDRNLVSALHDEDPELAPVLARLCRRRVS
ncbi:MAG: hypothetical protein ABI867_02985 [Kofleriaceae bacterium]